jgi:isopentenyldiphosphate isomerase
MEDEIYDIVNEDGTSTGKTATWTEVHTSNLLHGSVSILIFKDKSKKDILLHKRSIKMAQDPGVWQHSAGGHILAGDTPLEAIKKEISEELFDNGILPKMEIKEVVTYLHEDFPGNREILTVYESIYPGPFNLGYEAMECAWVNWKAFLSDLQITPNKYSPACRLLVKKYNKIKMVDS